MIKKMSIDAPFIKRMLERMDIHEQATHLKTFKATQVFVRCLFCVKSDEKSLFRLLDRTDLNVLRILIQEFALTLNTERAMEMSEEAVETGKIDEATYLENCNLLKRCYEVSSHCVKYKTIVVVV